MTIQGVADGAQRQVETAEQSCKVMHEMAANVQQIASSTEAVSVAARNTSNQAMEGNEVSRAASEISAGTEQVMGTIREVVEITAEGAQVRRAYRQQQRNRQLPWKRSRHLRVCWLIWLNSFRSKSPSLSSRINLRNVKRLRPSSRTQPFLLAMKDDFCLL